MRNKKYTEALLTAFLKNKNITEIQEEVGVSRQTIWKYQRDPEFQNELRRRRAELIKAAVGKMQTSLADVANVAIEIATDPEISSQIRLNACQIVFSQCRNWTELTDILERLEKVEAIVGEVDRN